MGVNGIYGLSGSGIDIESMVKVGMLTKQKQYDKMQQTYTKNEWTKQAYNEIYNKLTTYSASTLSPYKLSSNMSAKSATSSDATAVTATANGNAVVMAHKVEVNHLSANAYLVATDGPESIIDPNHAADNELALQNYIFTKASYNASSNTLLVYDKDGNMISDADPEEGEEQTVNVNDTAFEFTVSDGKTEKTLKYTYGELLGITQRNNGTLKHTDGNEKTFNDFVSDFNALGTNIKANYDAVTGRFSFYNKDGGEDNTINFTLSSDETVSKNTAAFFQGMKLAQSIGGELKGQDVNGESVNFYDSDGAGGIVGDTAYIGSGLPNGGTAAVLQSDVITVDNEDNEEVPITSDTALNEVFSFGLQEEPAKFSIVGNKGTAEFIIENEEDEDGNNVFFYHDSDSHRIDLSTVGDFVKLLDSESDKTGVNVSFDEGIFTFESTTKGESSTIEITVAEEEGYSSLNVQNMFDALNLTDPNASDDDEESDDETAANSIASAKGKAPEVLSFGIKGENGLVTIDGVKYGEDGSITNNSVTAFGVTYKFHNETTSPVNISVDQDVDAIVDKIKSFVEDYNKILGALYDKYEEKQYKDYTPLTASQKENMKDDQIEKWEEKAKSGLLYHDQTISKITTKMREAISNPIEGLTGKYTSAYSLGISTTGVHGQLTLDEDKLRAALNDDSESVYNVFSTLSKDDSFDQNGIAQRLSDVMVDATKLIKDRAGTDDSTNDDSDLGTLMRNLQNKMSDFKKLLDAFEDRLYKKYDAMEVALSTLGMQLSFITGGQ